MINKITKNNILSEINLVEEHYNTDPIALAVSGGPDSIAMMFLSIKENKKRECNYFNCRSRFKKRFSQRS